MINRFSGGHGADRVHEIPAGRNELGSRDPKAALQVDEFIKVATGNTPTGVRTPPQRPKSRTGGIEEHNISRCPPQGWLGGVRDNDIKSILGTCSPCVSSD